MRKRRFSNKSKDQAFKWNDCVRILLTAGLTGIGIGAHADTPTGIIGGSTSGSAAYAAFVFSNGSLIPISDLPAATSQINSVAMSPTGIGLIGGETPTSTGYAAFVSPTGVVTSLSIPSSTSISAVSINQTGQGLIGGFGSGAYAALIAPDGTVNSLTVPASFIATASINNAGVGLIGGEGGETYPYAGYVSPNGTVTTLTLTTAMTGGAIYSAAVNSQGNGIIGGFDGSGAYAALTSYANSSASPISMASGNQISSVAINDAGLGLIGGQDASDNAYAAYIPANTTTAVPLFGTPFAGSILGVALNASGTGLLGGEASSNLYAALVQPNGTVTPLNVAPVAGQINQVALSDAGVGLVGGQVGGVGYAALVSATGAVTVLDVSNETSINSVALINAAVPTSIGSFLSPIYTQLSAVSALETRFIEQNRVWTQTQRPKANQGSVAHNDMNLASNDMEIAQSPTSNRHLEPAKSPKQNTIWLAPFGDFVHLKAKGAIPNYTNEVGGVLLAYDHRDSSYMVGAALGYAFNYVDYSKSIGHGKVQEEMTCLYGAYYRDHFWLSGVLWGGLYQFSNVRHTLSVITSTAKTYGWILSPHLEMASPWAMDQKSLYFVEPFFMLDWINSWQNHFTESGPAGFNLKVGNLYGSLLQSEAGLRFYERFEWGWGNFCLEEKLSYVNQAPFYPNSVATSFVGSASTFPIAVASTQVQNLGSLQIVGSFVPRNTSYPFGGFALQATAGSSYQSYFASVFGGIDF